LGGFDGYECLREVERIDLASAAKGYSLTSEKLKSLSQPIKNGVSYFN